jgi:hypothetical protein
VNLKLGAAVGIACLLLSGCFGSGAELSDSGKGLLTVSVEFPATSPAGSVQTATIEVGNPGPGDIDVLAVTFATIGPAPGERDLPKPIVWTGGAGGEHPDVVAIDPEPRAVSRDGIVYTFDGLAEGETRIITFELRVPDEPGTAANSLQVADGRELDRGRGVRLTTVVGG